MNNFIHPTSIVEDSVVLGNNNFIGPFCYLRGDLIIGDNNHFESHCSIGSNPEHRDYFFEKNGKIVIGNNNIFREFVTINAGTTHTTKISNFCSLLNGSYVGHDTIIENKVTISSNCSIGGFCYIMEGVNFGMGSKCHQNVLVGAYSMIGMNSTITKKTNCEPFKVLVGSPAIIKKNNDVAISRNNISSDLIHKINLIYIHKKNER